MTNRVCDKTSYMKKIVFKMKVKGHKGKTNQKVHHKEQQREHQKEQ